MIDSSVERRAPRPDPESAAWIADLGAHAAAGDASLRRLHGLLLRAARAELNRRAPLVGIGGPEVDDLAHQAADDAVVSILRRLPEFRGESRFTTWAYKFAVLEVSNKLSRHFSAVRGEVALDVDQWGQVPARLGETPEAAADAAELLAAVRAALRTQLSERQRDVFVAIAVDGIPLDAVTTRWAADRNAIYKVMFDARRNIRAALVANGYLSGRDDQSLPSAKPQPGPRKTARRPATNHLSPLDT
ncbi:MAG: sigma-70 family RNA polymerase sigma factor [Streptomyces sp.]|uniref:RNA polymerase sigma factor n=1 Tax=Streptomyces sp. TaxID=1931 RepID=UPI0025DACF0A|nr:sigma-70 family RNA polymerase sigma factor [Streptomyces sp.]MBW8801609.1 sigma-70 family RNA polymerase sigma factor [Streptomyces sp.]